MELYSLEDQSAGDMFLTQETSNILPLVPNFEHKDDMETCAGDAAQNGVLCQPIYSDISEDDAFEFPCSQVPNTLQADR